jgi:alpha-glucosidase (family GH31 glycosyl hydrolase)
MIRALGFHLSRWDYGSTAATRTVVEKMRAYDIPQDVQWNDIDYMDRFLDFTLDPIKYPKKEHDAFVKDLHDHGQVSC